MIDLDRVARAVGAEVMGGDQSAAAGAIAVDDVEHDSRSVGSGALFACIQGANHDGRGFAGEAVQRGAVALLVEAPAPGPVPNLVVPSVRSALGPAAAEVHGHPSRRLDLVGVTGTNGKTTTVRLLANILEAAGRPVDEIGTLTGARTTPEATDIQRRLAASVANGRRAVAMEVSSHALAQRRVDGCRFRVAAFTNLGRDHLDYHGDMRSYWEAKARLFTPERTEHAVVWTESSAGRCLASKASEEAVPVTRVGPDAAEVLELRPDLSRFRWRGLAVEMPFGGRSNVHNAVLAGEVAVVLGVDPAAAAEALAAVRPPPGRSRSSTPAGSSRSWSTTPTPRRPAKCPHGCPEDDGPVPDGGVRAGGERDKGKRPEMGAAAAAVADRVVVTSDNPRGEDPDRIIAEIVSGIDGHPDLVEEPDRRLAIRGAIAAAGRAT